MAAIWDEYVSLSHDESGKLEALSDKGQAVQRMLAAIDGTANHYQRRANAARKFVRRNAPRLLPVLSLILKHGKNRKEAICELMKIRRSGDALRKPTGKRSKRFCGSSDATKRTGDFHTAEKK